MSASSYYGDVALEEMQSNPDLKAGNWRKATDGMKLTRVKNLLKEIVGSEVLIRGHVKRNCTKSNKLGFLVLRQERWSVQCVAKQSEETKVSIDMIKFLKQLNHEALVEVIGVVSLPEKPVTGTTQQVEIQVRKVFCLAKSVPKLPLNVEDAARSEADIKAGQPGVNQDTRLNNRVLDLRTPTNHAIFHLSFQLKHILEGFFVSLEFIELNLPTILAGSSEGGSAVFTFDYKGRRACLAQSPQLHKQMAVNSGFPRVYVKGPVYRAEDSLTHRHLCQFTGFDVEMEIHKDYSELMDLVDKSLVVMLTRINEMCKNELEAIRNQYPFEPLKFLPETPRLTFKEGIEMLQESGEEVHPFADLTTQLERKLGQLVREKYNTDLYILTRFPLAVRPFYTMPCADDPRYSNSFDVFLRGEEIISGGQRIHDPEFLEKRARECGIDVETISTYIDSFRYGSPPHGGFGMGLERVVMLLCGLDNIRKTSLFPRDPHRLTP